jgi:hypothetical protein
MAPELHRCRRVPRSASLPWSDRKMARSEGQTILMRTSRCHPATIAGVFHFRYTDAYGNMLRGAAMEPGRD